MEIRGERECRNCGRRWSYYETGAVACPNCESLESVGVDERTRHTATPVSFDLTPHRRTADESGLADAVDEVKTDCREYVRRRGFVDAGSLLDLDDTYLAANELVHAADLHGRAREPTDEEAYYLLDLLRGADAGERPPPDRVPARIAPGRGLAYADAVLAYRSEVRDWLGDRDEPDGPARRTLGRIVDRAKRVRALQGDVEPAEVETLVRATREVIATLRDGDEAALARAEDRLDELG